MVNGVGMMDLLHEKSLLFFSFRYMKQVLNESLRLSALVPWAAKVQDLDIELGGHIIPKGVSTTLKFLDCTVNWMHKKSSKMFEYHKYHI